MISSAFNWSLFGMIDSVMSITASPSAARTGATAGTTRRGTSASGSTGAWRDSRCRARSQRHRLVVHPRGQADRRDLVRVARPLVASGAIREDLDCLAVALPADAQRVLVELEHADEVRRRLLL